jgi:hypothetical protein
MAPTRDSVSYDRVLERRKAVALARHYREFESLSIAEVACQLGRSPATVKAYFYDPTGQEARAVRSRYAGVARGSSSAHSMAPAAEDEATSAVRRLVRTVSRIARAAIF